MTINYPPIGDYMHKIPLIGDVDRDMLKLLLTELTAEPTTIEISSHGGDMQSGLAMADVIAAHGKITTMASGIVGSAAVPIFTSGSKRLIRPSAALFIHPPTTSGENSVAALVIELRQLQIDNANYVRHLMNKTNLTFEQAECYIKSDIYLSAQDAVHIGFADGIKEDF